MKIPKIPKGHKRQWVRCKTCRKVAYYDYVPFSLSNPIMTLPCHHGLTQRFDESVKYISAEEGRTALLKQGGKK